MTHAKRKGEYQPHDVDGDQGVNRRQAQSPAPACHPLEQVDEQEAAHGQVQQRRRDGDLDRKYAEGQQQNDADDGVKRHVDIGDDVETRQHAADGRQRQQRSQPGDCQANARADDAQGEIQAPARSCAGQAD